MRNLTVSASPHIANPKNSTRRIMLDVLIALLPCVVAATYFFGYHVLVNLAVCVAVCFASELLFDCFVKGFHSDTVKKSTAFDLSGTVTGVLLALNLPAKTIVEAWNFNIYSDGIRMTGHTADEIIFSFDTILLCIIGSLFAIMLVKMLFGGIGKNFANPAIAARIFLFICFTLSVVNAAGLGLSGTAGATWLSSGDKATNGDGFFLNMFLGNRGTAAVGETCMIAILLGFIYLSVRKVIDFRIPLIGLGGFMVFSFILDGIIGRNLLGASNPAASLFGNVFANVMAGGFLFGLVFMAMDYSTTPNTFLGHTIFILGYAFLTVVIRVFAGYPEGASFAILLMNMVTPLIDRYIIPKPFGWQKPLKEKKRKEKPMEAVK